MTYNLLITGTSGMLGKDIFSIFSQKAEYNVYGVDIILNEKEYVVLDIGMDPPFRMNKDALNNGINFAKHYLDQFLDNNISYPKSLS